jgi:hypothetical protein
MLHDVKVRTFDRVRKTELIEILTVDAASGDDAAEMALALRPLPNAQVLGVTTKNGFGPFGGAALEAEDSPATEEDEDSEPGPSNRELAMMGVKRGPGRPRKVPQT